MVLLLSSCTYVYIISHFLLLQEEEFSELYQPQQQRFCNNPEDSRCKLASSAINPTTTVTALELSRSSIDAAAAAGAAEPSSRAKKRLKKQAKSLGQYEFKQMAFTSDHRQVQERLAVLDTRTDIELANIKSEHDLPALPPLDYFEEIV